MKFILTCVSMLVLTYGLSGKGGSANLFPGNSGLVGHGQNHDGTFPGQGNFPGNGLGNGGVFPGGGHGNGGNGNGVGVGHGNGGNGNGNSGNGNGNGGNGNGNGGNGNGGGHGNGGNGNGGDHDNDDHGNGNGGHGGNGGGPVVTPVGANGNSLADAFGKYLLLDSLLSQNDDYDYDYAPPKMRSPRVGPCVTGPVLRTNRGGRKLLCDFDGSCPSGSDCQNGLCCHLTPVARRRRVVWP